MAKYVYENEKEVIVIELSENDNITNIDIDNSWKTWADDYVDDLEYIANL